MARKYTLLGTQIPGLTEIWSVNDQLLGDIQEYRSSETGKKFYLATRASGIRQRCISKSRAIAWVVR